MNEEKYRKLFFQSFAFCCLISSIISIPFILDFNLVPRLIFLAISIFITIYLISKHVAKIKFNLDFIILSYFAFVVWSCVSTFWSVNVSEAIFENSKLLLGFFVMCLSSYFLKLDKDFFISLMVKLSLLIFSILLIICVFQLTALKSFSKTDIYEVTGLNGHKNLLSSFLFLNMLFLTIGALKFKDKWKFFCWLAFACNLILIILLRTKGVWIGFSCAFLFLFVIYFLNSHNIKINSRLLIFSTLICFNIFFIFSLKPIILNTLQSKKQSVQTQQNKSIIDTERLTVWKKTYEIIEKHKLIGVGSGNWQINFPDATLSGLWRVEDLNYTFQRPHNDFLWILSETGIIGFNLYLLFIITIIVLAFRSILNFKHQNIIYNILPIIFLIGYLCISFFDFPKERIEHILWFNIIYALLYNQIKEDSSLIKSKIFDMKTKHLKWLKLLCLIIVWIGCLRLKGEYFTRKMYTSKNSGNFTHTILMGEAACNFFYSLDPTSVPIRWYIGNAYSSINNKTEAYQNFLIAHKQNPYNRNVLNDLGSSLILNGEINNGISFYKDAARISPRFDEPKLNLAAVYINQNKLNEAKTCLDSIYHDSERRKNYYEIIRIKQGQ